MKFLENSQNKDNRLNRHSLNLLTVSGTVENSLIILFHRSEFFSSDIKLGRHDVFRIGHRVPNRMIEVVDIHKLVTVVAAADHRKTVTSIRPVVEKREHPQTLRSDETLRTDNRNGIPLLYRFTTDIFSIYFSLAVRPDANKRIGLVNRMFFRNAVNCGRRYLNHTIEIELPRRVKNVAATVDLCRKNIFFRIKRQSRRAVNDDIAPFGHLLYGRNVAYIAQRELKPWLVLLRIFKIGYIQYTNLIHSLRTQKTDEINPEKTRAAGYENFHVEVILTNTIVLIRNIVPRTAVALIRTLPASAPRAPSRAPPPKAPPRPPSFGFWIITTKPRSKQTTTSTTYKRTLTNSIF